MADVYCPVCHSDYPADWKACPKDASSLLKSAQIGKYRIEGMLGVGGMGAVYKATNPDIKGSRVAIKVMNPAIAGAEQIRERFKREAAAVAALRTSHVVKVYDFNAEPDGTLYLVMELLDGHALRDEILPSPNYMDLARVQMVMEGALKGLAAAHKVGIVHRDLKPENIYVADTDDGEVPKLLDFGIARVRTQDKNLTHTGSLMGTASYMATEQIAAGVGEIGPWSDVYAMGAILYEMLAGAPAFGGSTVTEVLQRVLKSECVPLVSVRPGLPKEVYALIDRCMSNQPATRPQDAEAMRIALNAARLVPMGSPIPPPHKTKVDHAVPSSSAPGSSPGGTALGVMATEGRNTPLPSGLTPPPPIGHTPLPHATPATGSNTIGHTPLPHTTPATGSNPGVVGREAGVSAFGPTVGAVGAGVQPGTSPGAASPPAKKSKLPLIIGGVAIVGIGAFAAVKLGGGGGDEKKDPPKADAGVVAVVADAASTPDTQVAVTPDAPPAEQLPEFTKAMVKIAGGEYEIGEDAPTAKDALKKTKVTVPEFWIDKDEVTLEAVRKALANPKLGGTPADAPTVPARNVTWAQAAATCKALGKRLPSEAEWEVAARTTPRDASKAALNKGGGGKLVPTKHEDCSADGLCDMLGGVIEWTTDASAALKVVRGASFTVSPTAGWNATIHFRYLAPPTADAEVGFRCAWTKDMGAHKTGDSLKDLIPKDMPPDPNAPKDAPPKDAPKVGTIPPKPTVNCDDVDGLFRDARQAFMAGQYAAALSKAESGVKCSPEDRGFVTIGMAACHLKNAAKAKGAIAKINGPGKRRVVEQTCLQNGVTL